MAFVVPCLSIIVCYARIFYIVRKTAMKTHEPQNTTKSLIGSIKMLHNHTTYENNHKPYANKMVTDIPIDHRLHKEGDDLPKNNNNYEAESRSNRLLSKTKNEDLKFIDTSVESDYPPTLSVMQKDQQDVIASTASSIAGTINTTNIMLENENSNSTNDDVTAEKGYDEHWQNREGNGDSAVEESSSSLDNHVRPLFRIKINECRLISSQNTTIN